MPEPSTQPDTPRSYSDIATEVKMILGLKLRHGENHSSNNEWRRTIVAIVGYMNWPVDQWDVLGTDLIPKDVTVQNGVMAKVSFSCGGVTAVVKLGVFDLSQNWHVVLLDNAHGKRLVEKRNVDFAKSRPEGAIDGTIPSGDSAAFSHIIKEMAEAIHKSVISEAFNRGKSSA